MESFSGAHAFPMPHHGQERSVGGNKETFLDIEKHVNETLANARALLSQYELLEGRASTAVLGQEDQQIVAENIGKIKNALRKFGKVVITGVIPAVVAYYGATQYGQHSASASAEEKGTPIEAAAHESTENITAHEVASIAKAGIAPVVYAEHAETPGIQTPPASDLSDAATSLKKIADKALESNVNLHNCNKFTASVAAFYGHHELDGLMANQQISYMIKHTDSWKTVDAQTAQHIANNGGLVIAGLIEPKHGHTIVVVPGEGEVKTDSRFYPNVEGGGMSEGGRSDGTSTAGDVFTRDARVHVRYFTPS